LVPTWLGKVLAGPQVRASQDVRPWPAQPGGTEASQVNQEQTALARPAGAGSPGPGPGRLTTAQVHERVSAGQVNAVPAAPGRSVRRAALLAAVPLGGYAIAQVLGRRAGATRAERRQPLPGDQIVAHPQLVTDHAITIGAPPEAVWPWLTQLGWHRAGFYTPRGVDRLRFPANQPSLDYLDPNLTRCLHPGDVVPDGPPGTAWYVVRQAGPLRTLVLHSVTHVPAAWQREIGMAVGMLHGLRRRCERCDTGRSRQ
jgi:hypothetical protein